MIVSVVSFFSCGGDKSTGPVFSGPDSTGTVTDIDGNIYKTIKLNGQWWMAENLKATRYRNGDAIPNVPGNVPESGWGSLSTGAYCNYDNNEDNVATYGRLYNAWAVDDSRSIAPAGWHVASDEEWKQLEINLGMSTSQAEKLGPRGTDEGGKMKESGTAHWHSPNAGATNVSGFSALPGGYRTSNAHYRDIGQEANFWSLTKNAIHGAVRRTLVHSVSNIGRYDTNQRYGLSVRCVKD